MHFNCSLERPISLETQTTWRTCYKRLFDLLKLPLKAVFSAKWLSVAVFISVPGGVVLTALLMFARYLYGVFFRMNCVNLQF